MRNLAFPASQNLFVRDNPVSYNNLEKFIHNSTFELNPNTIVNIFWIELFLIYWYFCLITTKKTSLAIVVRFVISWFVGFIGKVRILMVFSWWLFADKLRCACRFFKSGMPITFCPRCFQGTYWVDCRKKSGCNDTTPWLKSVDRPIR